MKISSVALIIVAVIIMVSCPSIIACESEQYIDGYKWTFHRMQDGNKYHEARKLGEFTEGNTLVLTAPCPGRRIETVQVDWEDNRSEVRGELVVMPGNKRLGVRDISGKQRESWTVDHKTNRLRIEFSGKRGHRCRVRFIRVFYGANAGNLNQQMGNTGGGVHYKLVDRIKINNGKTMRKCRILKWDGNRLHVAIKKNNRQHVRKLLPAEITQMGMAPRWGTAIAKDGFRFPVRIKRMTGAMMDYEKKLDGRVVPKPLTDIHNFTSISFQ